MAPSRISPGNLLQRLLLLIAALFAFRAPAQTHYFTASHPLRLEGFGAVSVLAPDFQLFPTDHGLDFGVTGGSDLDFGTHLWVYPGLEVRGTYAAGPISNQGTIGGGPRVSAIFGRVQPYADALYSSGYISFNQSGNPNYTHNSSTVYTFGGGAEIDLNRGWAVKADVQRQRWHLTYRQDPFYPVMVSVGLRYQVHGSRKGPR